MFATSNTTWPHAPWFGLYELVSSKQVWGIEVAEGLNEAFKNLGIEWAEVTSVEDPEMKSGGERAFHIEFRGSDGQTFHALETVAA